MTIEQKLMSLGVENVSLTLSPSICFYDSKLHEKVTADAQKFLQTYLDGKFLELSLDDIR